MKRSKLTAGLAVVALGWASPGVAVSRTMSAVPSAPSTQPAPLSPWVALSALGSSGSSAALCASAAAASAVQGAAPGCVLPAVDAPPPVTQVPEGAPVPVAAPAAAAGFSILPLLLGLAGAAAIAALLLTGGPDEDEIDVEPITQA